MRNRVQIGTTGHYEFVVGPEHVIDFAGDGMPAVLSTPNLVRLLERTAREALKPLLEPGEATVGVQVEVEHLAPTPPGQRVVCLARVIRSEGADISFYIEARDQHELIIKGFHKRRIIRKDRFAERVERKH